MISETTIRRALNRIALLKFFPSGNSEALAAVAEMFTELYRTDSEVERAVSKLLHDPDMAEWPGAGVLFDFLKRAVYPRGMCKRDGRWAPSPANGPNYDIVGPDGSRYWVGGVFYPYPTTPWRGDDKGEMASGSEPGIPDAHPDAAGRTTGPQCETAGD